MWFFRPVFGTLFESTLTNNARIHSILSENAQNRLQNYDLVHFAVCTYTENAYCSLIYVNLTTIDYGTAEMIKKRE